MQAIVTKYHGPTNARGSRIKATAAAGSVIIPVENELSLQQNHKRAAAALADKFAWNKPHYGTLVMGGLPDGSYVHVFNKE